jgi:hypothetical protein
VYKTEAKIKLKQMIGYTMLKIYDFIFKK